MANIPVMQGPSSEMWMRAAGVGVPSVWDAFGEAIKGAANFYVESKRRKEEEAYRTKTDTEKTRQFNIGVGLERQKLTGDIENRKLMRESQAEIAKSNRIWEEKKFLQEQALKVQKVEQDAVKQTTKKFEETDKKVNQKHQEFANGIVYNYENMKETDPAGAKLWLKEQVAKYEYLPNMDAFKKIKRQPSEGKNTGKFTDLQKAQAEYDARQQMIKDGKRPESIEGQRLLPGYINQFLLKGKIPVNDESGAMGRPKNPAVGKTLPPIKRPQTTGVPGNITGQEQPQDTWGSSAQGTATQSPISNLQTQKEESLRKLPGGWWNQNLPPTNAGSRGNDVQQFVSALTPEQKTIYEKNLQLLGPGSELRVLQKMAELGIINAQ